MMTQAMLDVLVDPAAHDSLKIAIRAFEDSDPTDAANDAAHLTDLLLARLNDEAGWKRYVRR